jgi:outer membrane protein assembly factor BamB
MKRSTFLVLGRKTQWPLLAVLLLIGRGGDVVTAATPVGWPAFQGPLGSGRAALAFHDLGEQSIAWQVSLPGRGLSTPVVIGDQVIVTCSGGPQQDRLSIVCLDAATGNQQWERQLWATGRTMCHNKTSVAAPTPCSDGERIYALFSSNDLVCLDRSGDLVWLRGITADYPNVSNSLGMSSSLVVTEGVVVAQVENDSESYTLGLDALTGENRWRLDRPKAANWTSPTVLAQGIVGLQSKTGVDAVRVADGTSVWQYDGGASTIPSSCRLGQLLFVPSHGLTALSLADSEGGKPKQLWQSSRLSPGTPSPVAAGETVFTISRGDVLTAGKITDGERRWQLRLKGPFSATPVVLGERLLAVSETGLAQLIGFTESDAEVVGTLDLKDEVLASPAVGKDGVFLRSNSTLWKLTSPESVLASSTDR